MPSPRFRPALVAPLALLLAAAAGVAAPSSAPPAPRPVDPALVQKLLAAYRRTDATPEQKRQLVAQLLEQGTLGPLQLMAQLQRDLPAKEQPYFTRFERAAADLLRTRRKGIADPEKEVVQLRQTILAVSRTADLTKEAIVGTADPAMAKLEHLLTAKPDDVLAAHDPLKAARQELLDLVDLWHQATARLPESLRKRPGSFPEPAAYAQELSGKEELAAALATPMLPPDRAVLQANIPLAKTLDPAEARGILALNLLRLRLGIGALGLDPKLCAAARGHSRDMQERKFFAHDSPVAGKETPWKRAAAAGTSASAENIYMGSLSPHAALQGWWHSPGHHKNLTGDHKRIGLGRSGTHWTQMFGR